MPITPIQEFMNGGVVTVRDATLLKPGELQRAEECVYRKFDPAIWSAPGRTAYNTQILADTAISGLATLDFPVADTSQLFVWVGSYFYTSTLTGLTGSVIPGLGRGVVSCNLTVVATKPTLTAVDAYPFFARMVVGTKVYHPVHLTSWAEVTAVASNGLSVDLNLTSATTNVNGIDVQFSDCIPWATPAAVATSTMDTVMWDNHHFILCSGTTPIVRCSAVARNGLPGVAIRRAGLLPVTTWGTGVNESGPTKIAGSWSAILRTGTFWFVLTECIDPDGPNELESAYTANKGTGRSVTILTLSESVAFTFPLLVNTGRGGTNRATHYCIYMSDNQVDASSCPPLSTFKRYAIIPIVEQSTGVGAPSFTPTYFTGQVDLAPTGYTTGAATKTGANPSITYVDWVLPEQILESYTNPDAYARGEVLWEDTQNTGVTFSRNFLTYPQTTLTGNSPVVTGLKLSVGARSASTTVGGVGGGFKAQIQNTGGSKKSIEWLVDVQKDALWRWYFQGGQFDPWGLTLTSNDIASGLRLQLISDSWTVNALSTWTFIRECTISIFYSSTTSIQLLKDPTSSKLFRTVTYRSQIGTTMCDPTNFPPPSATTGTIFQGQLVTNDVLDPATIRYSLAGYPEYFPKPYVLKFATKDAVTCIRHVGQVLIVGMRNSIRRVNYLPTEADTDFQQGMAHEDLAVDHGILGTHAGTLFDLTGKGVILAYVSADGLYATDGITTRPLSADLDWSNLANIANLDRCVLQEYPKEKWLVLYYNPKGATHNENSKALVFYYDKGHVKEDGTLPCTGPISVSARSATTARIANVTYLLTGHASDGIIYVEDNGLTIPAGYEIENAAGYLQPVINCPKITTRLMYAAGLERTARAERIYLRSSLYGAETIVSGCTVVKDFNEVTIAGTTIATIVFPGMRVRGAEINPGTVVTAVTEGIAAQGQTAAVDAIITLSTDAVTSGTNVSLTFDTGTLTIMTSGEQVGDAAPVLMGGQLEHPFGHTSTYSSIEKSFVSTTNTTIPVAHPDNVSQGLQIHIERIRMPDDVAGEGFTGPQYISLDVPMRLHYFDLLVTESGMETNRASN